MSRENFAIKLTGIDAAPEYINPSNIFRIKEVPAQEGEKGKTGYPAHTYISSVSGEVVRVSEKVEDIEKRGGAWSIFKIAKV